MRFSQFGTFLWIAHHCESAIMAHMNAKARVSPMAHFFQMARILGPLAFGVAVLAGVPGGRREPEAPMRNTLARYVAAFFLAGTFAVSPPAQASPEPLLATAQTIAVYASVLHRINPQMPNWQSRDLARRVLVNAERWRLDANMLVAIVTVESRWHTKAVSRAGAIGLGQLMPGTAMMLGVDPRNPGQNLSGAARYLRGLMERFGSNHYDLVLAAYNAGPEAVESYGGIPPYDETQHYVVKVMSAWHNLDEMVHAPTSFEAAAVASVHGPDVDYWLDGVAH
jgi:soluble lytic murein transglycosylase-like protein